MECPSLGPLPVPSCGQSSPWAPSSDLGANFWDYQLLSLFHPNGQSCSSSQASFGTLPAHRTWGSHCSITGLSGYDSSPEGAFQREYFIRDLLIKLRETTHPRMPDQTADYPVGYPEIPRAQSVCSATFQLTLDHPSHRPTSWYGCFSA